MKTLTRSKKPFDIEIIEMLKFPVIMAPFHGVPVPVKIHELTELQIMECGDISLIETFADKVQKQHDVKRIKEAVKYAETIHKIVKAALVSPTYEQIQEMVGANLNNKEVKLQLNELEKKLYPLSPSSLERKQLENEIRRLRIWVDLILPSDFTNFIVCYCLGINKSDIKKINEKMLLDAAILAEKSHKAPHEYITGGRFTEFNKHDIDRRAWYELYKEREKHKKAAS